MTVVKALRPKIFRRFSAASILALGALMAAGCSSTGVGNPVASSTAATASGSGSTAASTAGRPPFPTLTAPDLQPPKQQNQNRPDVAFDPCTWIDDDTISHLGYDPRSRKRSTDIHAEYTFLGCAFKSPDKAYTLGILSGNRTLDEGRAKFTNDSAQIQDTTIDGHAALIVRPQMPSTGCTVLLQTKVGYIGFDRIIFADHLTGPAPERCSGIVDLVRGIIPRIGDS
ncbi:DUF3558 domain-containing protein [Nocardia sp. KC 131]|uniref:DUF3558 domain-containing protein n=1 Tax=Nocardia arseniciresistens TaxID=3392119 RepID=UPI00398F4CEF